MLSTKAYCSESRGARRHESTSSRPSCSHATGVHTCRGRTWRPEKSSWNNALVTLSSAQCRAYWSTRAPKPLYSPAAPSSATMDWKQSTGPRYWEMTAVTEEPVSKLSTMVLVPC
ncbi:hypothetical protein ISCGN_014334, partial [Ixodes scapularis]